MLVRGIEDSLLKTNKKAQSQTTMLYASEHQVYLLSPKPRKTPQTWNPIFALSQGPLQTPTWAPWSQQKLAMLFAQQQRPLPCSRLVSLSDQPLHEERGGLGVWFPWAPEVKGWHQQQQLSKGASNLREYSEIVKPLGRSDHCWDPTC